MTDGRVIPSGPIRWHVLVLAMLRRMLVQRGMDPSEVESQLGGNGVHSHVALIQLAASRLGIDATIVDLDEQGIRRVARWLADRVNPNAVAIEHYPDGWRRDRAYIIACTTEIWTPTTEAAPP